MIGSIYLASWYAYISIAKKKVSGVLGEIFGAPMVLILTVFAALAWPRVRLSVIQVPCAPTIFYMIGSIYLTSWYAYIFDTKKKVFAALAWPRVRLSVYILR